MKVLIPYVGGKAMFFKWIIQFFPEHQTYVEVFGGSGSILINKPRSKFEVYNDIDDNLVTLFRVLQNKEKSQELFRKLKYTLYARSELKLASEILNEPLKYNEIERAWAVYVAARLGFGGKLYSPSFGYGIASINKPQVYMNSLRNIIEIRKRLENVIIENLDWEDCMNKYDSKDTLFYLDPPYPIEVINTEKCYKFNDKFKTLEEHKEFLIKLKRYEGMIILSGYDNEVYHQILNDWKAEYKKTYSPTSSYFTNKIKNHNPERMEVIWINPQCLAKLKQQKLFTIM